MDDASTRDELPDDAASTPGPGAVSAAAPNPSASAVFAASAEPTPEPVDPEDATSWSTGTSSSVHVIDPPVPFVGATASEVPAGTVGVGGRPDRPVSRSVLALAVGAVAILLAGVVASAIAAVVLAEGGRDRSHVAVVEAAVLVPASVLAVVLLAVLRRRLRRRVDEPVAAMRDVASAVLAGDLDARSGRRGDSDLDALAEELDVAAASVQAHVRRLRLHAEWGAQSRMIFEALDLADDESDAHEVARQALAIIDPQRSVELLLAPHGSTELTAVASNPARPAPGCPVDEVGGCVAVRRAQPVVFDSSESINACPKLRGRPYGPCSGACVPVSIAGRPVGVLHTVAPERQPPTERFVGQLSTLATQLGNRLGAVRALESSRLEAATDKLTGLPNRRLLESQLATLIDRATPFVLVLADLDNFKHLNDSYGHEIGDRALQLFAQVLRDKVRGNDVIARLGGEEFVLVYPNMSVTTSIEAVERVRDGLTQSLAVSSLPEFTCSFGITHSSVGRSGDSILRVADAGLLRAKELGRDQVVYADETLAARVFGDDDHRR